MIYYIVGLITSTLIFSIFLAALGAPTSGQYGWMVVLSLTLLSGAATLVFLIGLMIRMAHATRQRNQTKERFPPPSTLSPPSAKTPSSPRRIPLVQSELARHWIGRKEAPLEANNQDAPRNGEAIRHWLKGEIEKSASQKTKPGTHQMPGFESIKRP